MRILVTGITGRIGANRAVASSMKVMRYSGLYGPRTVGSRNFAVSASRCSTGA